MEKPGQRIKGHRQRRGWTALELANVIGVRETTIYRYESGGVTPSVPVRRALARAFDTTVEDLFGPDEAPGVPA